MEVLVRFRMVSKKRIEEIRNSHIGEDTHKELEECIREGDEMSRENEKVFRNALGL